MIKTILIMLMALIVSTPSLAEELTQNNLFSIENTFWAITGNSPEAKHYYAFHEGHTYRCNEYQIDIQPSLFYDLK